MAGHLRTICFSLVLACALLCSPAFGCPQSDAPAAAAPSSSQNQSAATPTPQHAADPNANHAADAPTGDSQATKPTHTKAITKKKASAGLAARKRTSSKRNSPRFRRIHQAFVASATLKPMAKQLLQNRTPQAYAGVETFARKHSAEDAGSLAWLAVGYAHYLDRDFAKAVDPLSRAKPHAGDIGDYVAYYLAASYQQSGRLPEAVATLSTFDETLPQSLLVRDAHVLYANALLADNRAKDAVALLERDREPVRADLELALGRAYAAAGDPAAADARIPNQSGRRRRPQVAGRGSVHRGAVPHQEICAERSAPESVESVLKLFQKSQCPKRPPRLVPPVVPPVAPQSNGARFPPPPAEMWFLPQ